MCDPVTLAVAAGLMAGGTYMQSRAAASAADAAEAAQNAEGVRQAELQQQAQNNINMALQSANREESFDEAVAQEEERIGDRLKAGQQDLSAVDVTRGAPESAPQIVADFETGQREANRDYTNELAERRARLAGFNQALVPVNIDIGRSAQDNQILANFMSGSANVLPVELQAAANKRQSPLGDLMVAAGQAAAGAGLTGGAGAPTPGGSQAFQTAVSGTGNVTPGVRVLASANPYAPFQTPIVY